MYVCMDVCMYLCTNVCIYVCIHRVSCVGTCGYFHGFGILDPSSHISEPHLGLPIWEFPKIRRTLFWGSEKRILLFRVLY